MATHGFSLSDTEAEKLRVLLPSLPQFKESHSDELTHVCLSSP